MLSRALNLGIPQTLGHLHLLWHTAIEQQEDGDLSKWPDDLIAELAGYSGNAQEFVKILHEIGWLDAKIIHDWWNYAGNFLISKYKHYPAKWKKIRRKYKNCSKNCSKNSTPNLTNLTIPNQPNITKPKKTYGEFRHVFLADNDLQKLRDKFGEAGMQKWIKTLDEGIEQKGYKYKNHYLTILKWAEREPLQESQDDIDKRRAREIVDRLKREQEAKDAQLRGNGSNQQGA